MFVIIYCTYFILMVAVFDSEFFVKQGYAIDCNFPFKVVLLLDIFCKLKIFPITTPKRNLINTSKFFTPTYAKQFVICYLVVEVQGLSQTNIVSINFVNFGPYNSYQYFSTRHLFSVGIKF